MGHVPYGYRVENGKAYIYEPEAKQIKSLFDEFLKCGSMRAAAKKAGIDRTHSVISRFIQNANYLGTDFYPQLLDEEIFHQANALKIANAKANNRIKVPEKEKAPAIARSYTIGKIKVKYDNPYKQAAYAYSQIEEGKHE